MKKHIIQSFLAGFIFLFLTAVCSAQGTTYYSLKTTDSPIFAGLNRLDIRQINEVYLLGDSLTYGASYATQLATSLGTLWWGIANRGVGGDTTTQMAARIQTDVIAMGDAKYIVIFGGVNDVVGDVAAATIEANLQATYTAAHNAGIKVIAVTITPFKGHASWTAGRQAILDTVNSWILSSATNIDYKVDAYSALEDPATPDTLLPTYDDGEHLHLSAVGDAALGAAIYNNVTWTEVSTPYPLHVTATGIALSQSLRKSDSPQFASMTLTGSASVAGKLSLGTTNTTEVLNIAGKAQFVGSNYGTFYLTALADSTAYIDFDIVGLTSGEGSVRFFRSSSGANTSSVMIYQPGTVNIQTKIAAYGDTYFNALIGNTGFGTTTPQGALDVGAPNSGRSIVWGGSGGATHYSSIGGRYSTGDLVMAKGLKLSTAANTLLYSYATFPRSGIMLGNGNGDILFFNEASATKTIGDVFDFAANTKMIIKESGYVGIGATPNKMLEVSTTKNNATLRLTTTNSDSSWATTDEYGAIEFYSNDSTEPTGTPVGKIASLPDGANSQYGKRAGLVFYTLDGDVDSVVTERMRISKEGKVSIRVAAATAWLHLPASEASANLASLKIDAGIVATTPVSGNVESDGTHLYWTDSGGTRKQLDN
jgi:lysophospholipase L1-like esterase